MIRCLHYGQIRRGLIPLIGAVLAPRRAKRERAFTTAVAANQITPEPTVALNDRAVRWARIYEESVVVLVLLLMVLKPF